MQLELGVSAFSGAQTEGSIVQEVWSSARTRLLLLPLTEPAAGSTGVRGASLIFIFFFVLFYVVKSHDAALYCKPTGGWIVLLGIFAQF